MKKIIKDSSISEGKAFNIIQKPIMTEKSTNLAQFNQYCFKVDSKATSIQIKESIEKVFKVKVLKVHTLNVRGKPKTFKGKFGFKKNYKKAIVSLKEGNTIDSSLEVKWV